MLNAGLLHEDVHTVYGTGLRGYAVQTTFTPEGVIKRTPVPDESPDTKILAKVTEPFSKNGGLKVLSGSLGTAIMKVSAVAPERHIIEAPAKVFSSQADVQKAFQAGQLNQDVVVVVRFLGPKAAGMPEAHKLTPLLAILQSRGFKVALVTDGRMSGASGTVPAAIHVIPEALDGGPIAKVRDGDIVRVDGIVGTLELCLDESEISQREPAYIDLSDKYAGAGRELFSGLRLNLLPANQGATATGRIW
ncbi:dihydroxy-acid dehydratase [Cohaesibacter celericrescens]|uniref:Dihydroxy-acid/6-phosphogluconate dehydratase C-terminal domain-containing protein n=1 Tax=Cohaesibacter celericrescens TaxID=2067669 RepID=A0A2N5XPW1_9HYPH|nr:dihydroxy-acid dehydratase [Cohaesibacter celericrescens]PLW76524.1 hypothetical protein C0081_14280 [Cohaesibacter celericrescens]